MQRFRSGLGQGRLRVMWGGLPTILTLPGLKMVTEVRRGQKDWCEQLTQKVHVVILYILYKAP